MFNYKVMLHKIYIIEGEAIDKRILEKATFVSGGCFRWMVQPFENTAGVTQVKFRVCWRKGEKSHNQDYAQKGYVEVVQVTYDPSKSEI